ncbi:unnamed protein product [Penicillium nalgiovense]|uniref:Uncharacterized protein n=1 Tax=Penicillium nalgiovense TaxID=60175 RepID=A0A1V6XHT3_PENNA|nr:hypothetical protein PENNAL_c0075G10793 [Penicillium nalgiovense]CAG7937467.1 unnamed protein product [Penicillium nalgiovense]CAG7937580.1 unnamed protein product [Penicillium nalgiovense]CAG7937641.1 unnamed protein product [Penicillium nalgiovense]CAG7938634.1 unnamed protein product [Penicillium nalgiovense]
MPSLSLYFSSLLSIVGLAQAEKFPQSLTDLRAQLKSDGGVTFDPLGVAAVLYNPRVDKSAARLYTQFDRGLFIWPHLTMIGGTLPPMQMLVERLNATMKWIHPSIKLCAQDTTMLPVRSDVSGNVFRQLPLNLSNAWLTGIISFQTSRQPGNDFAVVCVDAMYPSRDERQKNVRQQLGTFTWLLRKWALDSICLVNGTMLMTGMVCGILTADLWAFTLFLLYSIHWLASVLISFTSMVKIHKPDHIKNDPGVRYAVYERDEGGTVIFKGPQRELEEWARSTWEYDRNRGKDFLHWLWTLSGTFSGISSVACMVNMKGALQLAFLAVLVYSSLAEIVATRIARQLQTKAHGRIYAEKVLNNATRTKAIIRATLQISPKCRLRDLNWVKMGLLPPMRVFEKMQDLLREISDIDQSIDDLRAAVEKKCDAFIDSVDPSEDKLARRIATEVMVTLGFLQDVGAVHQLNAPNGNPQS